MLVGHFLIVIPAILYSRCVFNAMMQCSSLVVCVYLISLMVVASSVTSCYNEFGILKEMLAVERGKEVSSGIATVVGDLMEVILSDSSRESIMT